MKTLMITDLARTEELGRGAMAAVRGGMKMGSPYGSPSYPFGLVMYAPQVDSSIHATQDLAQLQNVVNGTANGSAFVDGVHVTNHTEQFGQNNIVAF